MWWWCFAFAVALKDVVLWSEPPHCSVITSSDASLVKWGASQLNPPPPFSIPSYLQTLSNHKKDVIKSRITRRWTGTPPITSPSTETLLRPSPSAVLSSHLIPRRQRRYLRHSQMIPRKFITASGLFSFKCLAWNTWYLLSIELHIPVSCQFSFLAKLILYFKYSWFYVIIYICIFIA